MTDIVERLIDLATSPVNASFIGEAADEIVTLRQRVKELEESCKLARSSYRVAAEVAHRLRDELTALKAGQGEPVAEVVEVDSDRYPRYFKCDVLSGSMPVVGTVLYTSAPTNDRDAYEGCREDLLDWKNRALQAEAELAALKAGRGKPVACYAGHRNTPEGTNEFYGYADNKLAPGTKLYTSAPSIPDGYVLVPVDVLARASESLGSFCSDEGWGQEDMDNMDSLDAYLAAAPKPKETQTCFSAGDMADAAAKAARVEREECAKVCDENAHTFARHVADTIRMRGKETK